MEDADTGPFSMTSRSLCIMNEYFSRGHSVKKTEDDLGAGAALEKIDRFVYADSLAEEVDLFRSGRLPFFDLITFSENDPVFPEVPDDGPQDIPSSASITLMPRSLGSLVEPVFQLSCSTLDDH